MKKKCPTLPAVSPEIMGTLKTLGQIAEFLTAPEDGQTPEKRVSNTTPAGNNILEENRSGPCDNHQNEIVTTMLAVVSQLTGYPVEMLGLDMDIEAELGIDSIKRVEILSALEEKMPALPAVSPEIMGTLKTLGQISEYLSGPASLGASREQSDDAQTSTPSAVAGDELAASAITDPAISDPEMVKIQRKVVTVVEEPVGSGSPITIAENRKVFVTEDNTGLSESLAEELAKLGINSVRIPLDISMHKNQVSGAAGLIIVQDPESQQMEQDLKNAFALAKHLSSDLQVSANEGGALFATVTRLDGAFGFKRKKTDHPVQGGLAGLAKTAAIEWENVCCHAIDIAAGLVGSSCNCPGCCKGNSDSGAGGNRF